MVDLKSSFKRTAFLLSSQEITFGLKQTDWIVSLTSLFKYKKQNILTDL